MKRFCVTRKLLWWVPVGIFTALGLSLAYPYAIQLSPEYAKEFTATGLVEHMRFFGLGKRHCVVEIATYRWINLSADYPLRDIPHEGDRYTLYATGELCQAVQVAMAASKGHILFQAGEVKAQPGSWHFVAKPEAAMGCGGLLSDWQPPPRKP